MALEECPKIKNKYCPHKTSNCKAVGDSCIHVINSNWIGDINEQTSSLKTNLDRMRYLMDDIFKYREKMLIRK
jgi:hypothetical protein